MTNRSQRVIPFDRVRMADVDQVGGKNASLGEMIGELHGAGIRVPGGFATTAFAFREFLANDGLDARIAARLASLDVDDVAALAKAGAEIRGWVVERAAACRAPCRSGRSVPSACRRGARRDVGGTLVGHGRGPARRPRSRASRKHSSTSMAWIIFFTLSERYLPVCTTIEPSPTACIRDSRMETSRFRRACSGWCAAISAPRG